MRAGKLFNRLTLQSPVRTPDNQGGYTLTWHDEVTVWAQIDPLAGREYMFAQQLATGLTHQVSIRYYPGLNATWRGVSDEGEVLNIRSVANPDGHHREHQLFCEQVIPSVD